jgi:hypothetical protein
VNLSPDTQLQLARLAREQRERDLQRMHRAALQRRSVRTSRATRAAVRRQTAPITRRGLGGATVRATGRAT